MSYNEKKDYDLYSQRIENWEQEYSIKATRTLSKRELDLLDGSPIKSHEGMMYGRMYNEWKHILYKENIK
jgi:hypothetical protein